jgi:hypothetical protein
LAILPDRIKVILPNTIPDIAKQIFQDLNYYTAHSTDPAAKLLSCSVRKKVFIQHCKESSIAIGFQKNLHLIIQCCPARGSILFEKPCFSAAVLMAGR